LLIYEGEWVEDEYEGCGILNNLSAQEARIEINPKDFESVFIEGLWKNYEGDFQKG